VTCDCGESASQARRSDDGAMEEGAAPFAEYRWMKYAGILEAIQGR
jgi:hypothetical protein